MRDAQRDACVDCVRRMRQKREISAQNVTHASNCDACASYRVSVTHASVFSSFSSDGEALLSTKEYLDISTGVVRASVKKGRP